MCGTKTTSTASTNNSTQISGSTPNNGPQQQELWNAANALPGTYTPYTGTMVAGTTGQQQAGYDQVNAGANAAQPGLAQAQALTAGVAGYQPQQVTGQGYTASLAGGSGLPGVSAQQIGPAQTVGTSNVNAQAFPDANLSSYLNPYTQNVVDSTARQIQRANAQQITGNQAAATAAGAYGGSRHGQVDVGTNEASQRVLGDTTGSLYRQGFDSAQAQVSRDQDRAYQASAQNASNTLQASGQNAQLGQQGALANQSANLAASTTNAGLANNLSQFNAGAQNQAAQFGAGAANTAGLANQSAGIAGAGLNLQAAGQLGNQAVDAQNAALQGGQAQMFAGQQQQQTNQAQADAAYQQWQTQQQFPYQYQQYLQGFMPDLGGTQFGTTMGTGTTTTKEPRNIVGDVVNAATSVYGAVKGGIPGSTPGQGAGIPGPVNGGFPGSVPGRVVPNSGPGYPNPNYPGQGYG